MFFSFQSKDPGSASAYMFVYTARSVLDELKKKKKNTKKKSKNVEMKNGNSKNVETKNGNSKNVETKNVDSQNGVCNGSRKGKRFTSKNVKKTSDVVIETSTANGEKVDESEIRFPDYFPSYLELFIEDDLAERRNEIAKQAAEKV